jgi:hypothetical protein
MVLPDYQGGSILNLMASIESACGGNPPYLPLRALPPDEIAGARNLILLVIDGLGHEHLISGCAGGALHRHLRAKITSVFPSTTATAITTFLTGLAPQQHGLTGWFTYFREIGSVAAVLPFRPRHGGRSYREAGIEVNALMGHTPFFDKIAVPSYVVSPEWIVHSDFNAAHSGRAQRRGYDTLDAMFRSIAGIVRESPERKYIYAYYPGLDALAHEYGIGSPRATTLLSRLDEAFERFLAGIGGSESTVIVSADHGFIDASPGSQIELEDHPSLAETLLLPLCGEPRAAYCYLHPEKTEQFETYIRDELSAQIGLFKSRQLVEEGWFGPGNPHPRLLDRVGHYTLVMRENYAIKDWLIGESRYTHIGQHGGVSEAEMQVPLIVAQA